MAQSCSWGAPLAKARRMKCSGPASIRKRNRRRSMRRGYLSSIASLAGLAALIIGTAILIAGQTAAPTKPGAPAQGKRDSAQPQGKPGPTPKTTWGEPDLQGTWFVLESVPLERPAQYAGRAFLTEDEVAALDKQKAVDPGRNSRSDNSTQDVAGAYNAVFNSVLKSSKRTSMITDPPDGKIPPLTPEAQQRQARGGRGGGGLPAGGRGGAGINENPETVAQSPRCLGVQMPFLPLNTLFAQGTVMQIVQSPKSMGIYMEDDHAGGGNRVIFMDGRPHPPANVKSVLGESRGHWEGSTLVV